MIWKIIVTLVLGGIAGWLAGIIMKSKGSMGRNIIIGVLGSIVGGFIAWLIGLTASGWIGSLIVSTAGACLCLFLAKKFLK